MVFRSTSGPPPYTARKLENAARYWWQSRGVVNGRIPPLFDLADIPALALLIRRTWGNNERTA